MTSYIGVDVGKKSLHAYLPVIDKSFEFKNNKQDFSKILKVINKYYNSLSDITVVFEPTGGYERHFREFLKMSRISFATVHPNKVHSYAKARGWLAKTDAIDLKSNYANAFALAAKQDFNSENQERLHSLIQRRDQLIIMKNQETNRLDTEFNFIVIKSIDEHVAHLDQQLKQTQVAIDELCSSDVEIRAKIAKLTSISGVGIILATNTICQAPEISNIEFSQLTSLLGLAPYAKESGSHKGRRSAGRASLRKVLYMAAVASLRCNHKLKAFYDRLIANHKPPKVALVAVMRKLLSFMHAIIKNDSCWAS